MTNVVSALTARTQLGQIIKRATEKNERFVIDRRGQPSVVIMSMKDYIDTVAPAPKELRAMQERAKKTGLSKLTMRQIDDIIAEVRREPAPKKTSKRPRK
jgi:prevent-host-death family protein